MAKRSASRRAGFTGSIERAKLQGGRGRGRRRRPDPPSWVALFRRLRRLELALAYSIAGKPKDFSLDRFLKAVLELKADAETNESWSPDEGGEVSLPYEGAPPGEAARAPGVDWGPESRHGPLRRHPPPDAGSGDDEADP